MSDIIKEVWDLVEQAEQIHGEDNEELIETVMDITSVMEELVSIKCRIKRLIDS